MKVNDIILVIILITINSYAQENISTSPFDTSRTNIVFESKRNDSSVNISYSLRWDLSELKKIYLLPFNIYNSFTNINLSKDVKLKYYGLKISPFKIISVEKKKKDISGNENAKGNGQNINGGKSKKSLGINLSALYDDVGENINNFILDNSLGENKDWKNISRQEKKEFINDLLKIDIWDYPVLNTISKPLKEISQDNKSEK